MKYKPKVQILPILQTKPNLKSIVLALFPQTLPYQNSFSSNFSSSLGLQRWIIFLFINFPLRYTHFFPSILTGTWSLYLRSPSLPHLVAGCYLAPLQIRPAWSKRKKLKFGIHLFLFLLLLAYELTGSYVWLNFWTKWHKWSSKAWIFYASVSVVLIVFPLLLKYGSPAKYSASKIASRR